MRAMFFLLLASNIVLFGYFQWIAPQPAPPPQPPHPAGGSLVLLSEEDADTPPPPPSPGELSRGGGAPTTPVCFESPVHASRQAAEAARARDADDAARAEIREQATPTLVGFWAYIPVDDGRDGAEELLADLIEAGVRDVGIVSTAVDGVAVSLGVFTSRDRAERRGEEVTALGFDVQVGERERLEARYTVFAQWPRHPTIIPSDWSEVDCQR